MDKLFNHQKDATRFVVLNNGCGAVFHEMGLGKTRTAIEIFQALQKRGPLKLLVIAPISLLEAAWGADIRRFADLSYYINMREAGIPEPATTSLADVFLINYDLVIRKPYLEKILKLIRTSGVPWMVVVDESSRMKDPKSLTSKVLLALRDVFKHRVVMSGTPAPNGEMEYWAQVEFVAPGLLEERFSRFRNLFFQLSDKRGRVMLQGQFMTRDVLRKAFIMGYEYEMIPSKEREFLDRLKTCCHFAVKRDCLDLPDQVDEMRLVSMGQWQAKAYREMKRDFITWIQGHEVVAQVALTKLMKLRQITGGFGYDEQGEAQPITTGLGIPENAKMREFMALVDEIGDRPVIVWCEFRWEIRALYAKLIGVMAPERVGMLYGGTEDKDTTIADFQGGRIKFLIAHPQSAAHGLTFVNCSLEVFYSMGFSFEHYEQARARIHRAGQVNKCTYVHLLCKGTVDETIYRVVKAKKDQAEIVYEFLESEGMKNTVQQH